MNIDKYKEEVSKEFVEAWDKSYGRAIYGEWGFQTCDLGSPKKYFDKSAKNINLEDYKLNN